MQFQSTLPQGERRLILGKPLILSDNFNPRSHKGSDGKAGDRAEG